MTQQLASVALVTGGASGLGRAVAERLVGRGGDVVIVDLPSSAGAEVATQLGDRMHFVAADVTDEQQLTEAVEYAGALGPLRVAASCAGVATPGRVIGRAGPLPLADFGGWSTST